MGRVTLHEKPGGRQVGDFAIRLLDVNVLGARAGWTRISVRADDTDRHSQEYLPFSFDAWTQAEVSSYGSGGPARCATAALPTHVTTGPLELRVSGSAEPVATVARGVPVLVGPVSGGFVPVQVPMIQAAEGSTFWIEKSAAARLAPAPR